MHDLVSINNSVGILHTSCNHPMCCWRNHTRIKVALCRHFLLCCFCCLIAESTLSCWKTRLYVIMSRTVLTYWSLNCRCCHMINSNYLIILTCLLCKIMWCNQSSWFSVGLQCLPVCRQSSAGANTDLFKAQPGENLMRLQCHRQVRRSFPVKQSELWRDLCKVFFFQTEFWTVLAKAIAPCWWCTHWFEFYFDAGLFCPYSRIMNCLSGVQ